MEKFRLTMSKQNLNDEDKKQLNRVIHYAQNYATHGGLFEEYDGQEYEILDMPKGVRNKYLEGIFEVADFFTYDEYFEFQQSLEKSEL